MGMANRAAVILAAGQGTRMLSALPKVLHQVGGRPMIDWSIALAQSVGCERILVVCSPAGEAVQTHVANVLGSDAITIQDPPLGTGHAVLTAKDALSDFDGELIVLCGDVPLIESETVEDLFAAVRGGAAVGVLGFEAAEPGAYGRLITDTAGNLDAIVEAKEATPEQLQVSFCNSGVIAAPSKTMFDLLSQVTNDNIKGEYYLTDIVGLARAAGGICRTVSCDEADVIGINTRIQLAEAEAAFQTKKRAAVLASGVTMTAPETVFFNHDTEIENDVTIEPNVVFGSNVTVRSGARIRAFSHLEGADIGPDSSVGPFVRLRPGAVLEANVKIGNFVEVKNTRMGVGAQASHLAYLGDGEIGAGANIGAGTIFCNYDGFLKHKTTVGNGAFIGSNSALVAPVTIGDGAFVGSGSVITKDVEANALAVGRGRQMQKAGWATAFRDKMAAVKAARKKG